jgi:anti-sigma-K factor RskA
VRESLHTPAPRNFVAVFQKDDSQPAFLMSVDLASREITIRAITADRQAGKTYQLWILAEPLGPVPRSLGLLEDVTAPTRKTLSGFDPALLQNATFGISVEPPGGSPTGRPTGPALHGKLLQATP